MTTRQLVYGLQEQLSNLFGEVIYEINTTDILYYLNKAQNQIVKNKVQLFEQTQYITDELRTLVKESILSITGTATKTKATLPIDYNILVRHSCITIGTCGSKTVGGIQSREEFVNQMLKDPFWKPTATDPIYYIVNDGIIYPIPDSSFTINSTEITYIKKEAELKLSSSLSPEVNSELPEFVHEEIVNIARELIIQDKQLTKNNN